MDNIEKVLKETNARITMGDRQLTWWGNWWRVIENNNNIWDNPMLYNGDSLTEALEVLSG